MSLAAAFFLGAGSRQTPRGTTAAERDARVDDAHEQTLEDLVDAEIDRLGGPARSFAADMEARYHADLLGRRRSFVRLALLVFLAAQVTIGTVQSLVDGFVEVGRLRDLAVVLAWGLACRVATGRVRSVLVVDGLLASCLLLQLALIAAAGFGELADTRAHGALDVSLQPIVILAGCSVLRLPQRFAQTVIAAGVFVALHAFARSDLAVSEQVLGAVEIGLVALAALAANAMMERADREAYLMRLRAALQLERTEVDKAAIERIAQLDPLTGVANRRVFDMKLEAYIRAATPEAPFVLALVDVDHFKSFNDLEGHVSGDECLRRVAAALRLHAPNGLVARYGGEEFGVLLPNHAPAAVDIALEKLRSGVERLALTHRGRPDGLGRVTVSIGAAVTMVALNPRALIDAADAALYRAKGDGRNRIQIANPDADGTGPRPSTTTELRRLRRIADDAPPLGLARA